MTYFAVYETSTGILRSLGTVLADPMPPQFTVIDIGTSPADNTMWDETTRTFIPRPPKVFVDRLEDLRNRPAFKQVWNTLNQNQRDAMRQALIWILGKARFRPEGQSEPIE
ncbi:hypothetical protein LCGC14_3070680 [marine sediment metagenome]|uniref:Uncharacterized protein n=1 Tax=marine sediment metagenome TaxID=412755 RepID=A0A0F8X4J0_9ZZZZ